MDLCSLVAYQGYTCVVDITDNSVNKTKVHSNYLTKDDRQEIVCAMAEGLSLIQHPDNIYLEKELLKTARNNSCYL